MSSFYDFNVTLYRDSLSTPWGFRLEGGREFSAPLTIQRVFTGSPASGDLQRGDILLGIQHRDASNLFHQEANDIIKHCGGSIQLVVRRGQMYSGSNTLPKAQTSYRPPTSLAFVSQPPLNRNQLNHSTANLFYAEDPITNYVRSRPIEKVKDPKPILSQTGSPMMPGDTPVMSSRSSIKRYKANHTMPLLPTTNFDNKSAPYIPAHNTNVVSVPHYANTNITAIPYSDKRMVNQIQQSLNKAIHSPKSVPFHPSTHAGFHVANHQSNPLPYSPTINKPPAQHFVYPDGPVWKDTLRKTGANIFEDPHHQHHTSSYHVGPSYAAAAPKQITFSEPQHQPKSPKVVNLQYNSPIGLYSNENIKEVLHKKIGNQPHDLQLMASSEF